MHSVIPWTRWLILVLLLTTGCNQKPSATTSTEDGEVAASSSDGSKSKKSVVPVKRNVKDVLGNWVFVVTNGRSDSYRWLIKFSKGDEGKITGEFIDVPVEKDEQDKMEIATTEVNGDNVRLVLKGARGELEFVGTFQQGFIRGTTRANPFEIYLTRLLPTDEKSLEKFSSAGLPPGADVFEARMKSKDFNPHEFLKTIHEYRISPLAQDMYSMMIKEHIRARFDEAQVKSLIDDFLSSAKIWGERWEARIEMNIAVNLINGRQFAPLALSHIESAEQKLGSDLPVYQTVLNGYRDAANVSIKVQELSNPSSTEEVKASAYASLVELLKNHRSSAEILLALGTEAQRTGQVDTAIEYISDIVALPMLEATILSMRAGAPPDTPTPTESLKKFWMQKHDGNEDGLQQHVIDVYHAKIDALLAEMQEKGPPAPALDSSNKTVLAELFTGMICPPCVSADLALEGISRTFPLSKVIVLRYHQHIPQPDGLVNQDSEERGALYEIAGTPSIFIDGVPIDPRHYVGPIAAATNGYGVLRKIIDPRLSEKTDIALQLSATVIEGQLTVTAEATGIPDDVLPSCRLRMAIVENNVQTNGPMVSVTNGIRDHEYLVREMPGGAKGIPPKNGELKYSLTMPISDLQQHVADYIARFEAGRRGEFPAELKPPIRGPLSFVAWIQNGNPDPTLHSRLVLQSSLVPVTGETGFTAVSSTESTIGAKPAKPTADASAAPADSHSEVIPPAPALPE